MRMRVKILGLLLLFPAWNHAQSAYSDYSSSQKTTIFFDDFNSNSSSWRNTTSGRSSIENGKLVFKSGTEYAAGYLRMVRFDENKNFEIETTIYTVRGQKSKTQGVVFGKADDSWDNFNFNFTMGKEYLIYKRHDNKQKNQVTWTKSNAIKNNAYNRITIRKVDDKLYFFINKTLVNTLTFEPFFGNDLGFHVDPTITIKVDYFRVSYLKERYNYPPRIVISRPSSSRNFNIITARTARIEGQAIDDDGIYKITANGKQATLQSGGYFYVDVPLSVGDNRVTIKATDNRYKSSTKTVRIRRKSNNFITNEKRVALVFGNSNYSGAANLGNNPINDARDIASTLKTLGFDVTVETDANLTVMNQAIRSFGRQNRDADVALFYFAGHGMQVEKVNYLLPVGVNIRDKQDVSFESVDVNTVQKVMETSNSNRLNLIILDACRNNPFRTWQRGGKDGLADMMPPSGTLIAYATSPGSTASNGNQRNGLYTGELIKQLRKPQRIEDVFINTRIEVENKSGGAQSPWELARLRGIFYLKK